MPPVNADGLNAALTMSSIADVTFERFPKRRKCFLCGGMHRLQNCTKYEAFAAAVEHNEGIEAGDKRRCAVCRGIGHNRKSCGWVFKPKKR
jgi:hypothetical protein